MIIVLLFIFWRKAPASPETTRPRHAWLGNHGAIGLLLEKDE